MYKLCLLGACLACAGNGRRLRAALDQYLSSQDLKGPKLMKQLTSSTGSRSHGQGDHSRSGQFAKNMANPRKAVPILLTFFSTAAVFAPSWNGMTFNSSSYDHTQKPISSNPIGTNAGPRVVMMDRNYVEEEELPESWGPLVRVVVSVDWGGVDLRNENLRFFKDFRAAHPKVPLTHFLNAAYFTKPEVQSNHEWSPYQALSPIDELGLHIYGVKSLVESSGVQYRSEPNILKNPEELEKFVKQEEEDFRKFMEIEPSERDNSLERIQLHNYLSREAGYDTDIRAYSVDELQAIISKSKSILAKQGFDVGKAFRVGARLAGPNVLEAFRREGFRVNSSAVNFDEIIGKFSSAEKDFWSDAPLTASLRELWPGITKESQPFIEETPVGWILEMPDTGAHADHTTVKDMVDHVDSAIQRLESEDRFVQISFDQETAATHGPAVIAAITEIKRKHPRRVIFETLEASAVRARAMQRLKEWEILRETLEASYDSVTRRNTVERLTSQFGITLPGKRLN